MGQSKKSNKKGKKPYPVSSKMVYINKGDRMHHWVGHSNRKELDINGFFESKEMIVDMKAELTESPNKLQMLTIWWWLKRQMLMKPSLQKPSLATI